MQFRVNWYTPKGSAKAETIMAAKMLILQGNLAFFRAQTDERPFSLVAQGRWASVEEVTPDAAAQRPVPDARG